MNVLIIANPIAGGGHGRLTGERLRRELEAQGLDASLYFTQCKGDGEAAARRSGFDCVVSVGGDGSASDIVNGLGDSGVPLAVQPLGTANVLARELGVPSDPAAVAAMIRAGRVRHIDCGRMGDRRFIMGAGAGIDAAIVNYVDQHRGKRLGFMGWVWPTVRVVLTYSYPRFRVCVDGEELCANAEYAVVGICRYSAGMFRFTPEARLDDGLFDVCVFPRVGPVRLARLALASFRADFARRRDLIYRQGKSVVVEPVTYESAAVQRDGDPAGTLPLACEVLPARLPVIVPED